MTDVATTPSAADTAAPLDLGTPWRHRWADLGPAFSTELPAVPLAAPHLVSLNEALARELGLDPALLASPDGVAAFTGNLPLAGSRPLATVYSGHQFGVWAGQLGDGRALLLGAIDTPQGPQELQLKGAGRTPYSRMGDGRAVLRSSIREYLCSEAMHGLGIPTTRALMLTGSPSPVRREEIETAAVVTRVAPSFIRFGHFEHFAHTEPNEDALRRLADLVIDDHLPELRDAEGSPYAALLAEVTRRTALLMAEWQRVGFAHGVMNTDNMSILGLTIDYGPFGFLDAYDPGHICNHSDHGGRYAFARQPNVAFWNLHALATALMPLIGDEQAALAALDVYRQEYPQALARTLRNKLGLAEARDDDPALAEDLLRLMAAARADHTITFRRLAGFSSAEGAANEPLRDLFLDREAFDAWAARYAARLRAEGSIDAERALRMNRVNPKYILRNHLAENAIRAAREGDFGEVNQLLKVLERPYDEQPQHEATYAAFPPDWAQLLEVSCSS
jgi:uncharacterized protein YdiU (UPF0061 family)